MHALKDEEDHTEAEFTTSNFISSKHISLCLYVLCITLELFELILLPCIPNRILNKSFLYLETMKKC